MMEYHGRLLAFLAFLGLVTFGATVSHADWPRWRGSSGTGEWNPDGFPGAIGEDATKVIWKAKIGGGYSGVTVSGGKVFTMDYAKSPTEQERVLCFDAGNGEVSWEHAYPVSYKDLDYGSGPRASVTIDSGKAYTLGSVGHVRCLDVETGEVLWNIDTVMNLQAQVSAWGFAASPVIWNDLVVVHVAAQPDGCYLALNKSTGVEVWRSHGDPAGYATPLLIKDGEAEQFVCWTPEHVLGLRPSDGAVQWSIPYKVKYGVSIATPIFEEGIVLVSGYWHGTRAIKPGPNLGEATLLWSNEEELCGLMSQPLYKDGHAYLLDKSKGVMCFELKTGKIRWKSDAQLTPQERNPQATMVWADQPKNLAAILNSNGELIVAEFKPEGVTEKSRLQVIGKTWAHPAYSGNRLYARSDREIVAVRLWNGTQ